MGIVSQQLRNSARGQACTFRLPGICNGDSSTVVLCHCRIGHFGGGCKPPDFFAAFGCFDCHAAIDNHRVVDEERTWLMAILRTWLVWFEEGLLSIPTAATRQKPLPKIVPHDGRMRR